MTQVKRGKNWFAVLRLSYEVLPKQGGDTLVSGRFDKAVPLSDGDLNNYVMMQSALAKEWLDGLLVKLKKANE